MATIESKSMDKPDEMRTPDKTMVSVVHLGPATVARFCRWSQDGGGPSASSPLSAVRAARPPISATSSRGKLHIASTDGSELDLGPGDAYRLDPGHDAWVVGDHPFVALEFESETAETYAKG
jgi:hypothetical protein